MKRGLAFVLLVLGCALTILVTSGAVAATTGTNLGWENGLSGWDFSNKDLGLVVSSQKGNVGTYSAQAGTGFLTLKSGCFDGTARQTVTLKTGRTVAGWAAFIPKDMLPYNDSASVQIRDTLGNVLTKPYSADTAGVGVGMDGAWTAWSFTAPAAGNYIIQLTSSNAIDCTASSIALFDAATSSMTASTLIPGLAMSAKLTGDGPTAGKTVHFTCAGCAEITAVTGSAGIASVDALSAPEFYVRALLAGGYCAEFYGDSTINGSSACAGRN